MDNHNIKINSRIRTLKMGQMEGVVTGFEQSNGLVKVLFKHENGKTYATVPSNVEVLKLSLSEQALKEHVKRGVPLIDSIFRPGSKAFFEVFAHAKKLQASGKLPKMDPVSQELLETDIGTWSTYRGRRVPLDWPIQHLDEAEYQGKTVNLNKPKRGGSKAYYVYVRKPDTGNVIKVEFGSGMRAKINDPEARKRYDNRHGCSKGRHNDKTKAGYWSCRLPRYSKSLGLSGAGQWW